MFQSHKQILDAAARMGRKRFVVAGAENATVLEAMTAASELGIVQPILVGVPEQIHAIAEAEKIPIDERTIVPSLGARETARKTVALMHKDEAEVLMKGTVDTPTLLKAVLNKQYNLRTGRLLSHVAIMEVPSYPKLLCVSDGAMIIKPTFDQKIQIVHNAVLVMKHLGIDRPKVALMAAIEKINPDMPETLDAQKIVLMARGGYFPDAIVEGPMAIDLAFSREAARIKAFDSLVSGEPDILIMPDIASGNIFAKGLVYLAGAAMSGLIVGARRPIVLISRSDSAIARLNSIALAHVVSDIWN